MTRSTRGSWQDAGDSLAERPLETKNAPPAEAVGASELAVASAWSLLDRGRMHEDSGRYRLTPCQADRSLFDPGTVLR